MPNPDVVFFLLLISASAALLLTHHARATGSLLVQASMSFMWVLVVLCLVLSVVYYTRSHGNDYKIRIGVDTYYTDEYTVEDGIIRFDDVQSSEWTIIAQ